MLALTVRICVCVCAQVCLLPISSYYWIPRSFIVDNAVPALPFFCLLLLAPEAALNWLVARPPALPTSILPLPQALAPSRILQQPFPLDGLGEDLPLQPHLVAVVEVLRQVHALAQHALQAVVHGRKVAVAALVIAAAVELLDALAQRALLRLEVPGTRIDVCWGGSRGMRTRRSTASFVFSPKTLFLELSWQHSLDGAPVAAAAANFTL